jgi:hypothetical protein
LTTPQAAEERNADMPKHAKGLSRAQAEQFITRGYCLIEEAFSADLADLCRRELWAAMRLSPDDPTGWTKPVVRVGFMAQWPFVDAANTPRLHVAYDALVGRDRWLAPTGLGTFPIRFPSSEDPGDLGWHVDMSFEREVLQRIGDDLGHPFVVHSAQPNRGVRPRFMAQPPLLPRRAFDPALPPSPMQIAIRRACGLDL